MKTMDTNVRLVWRRSLGCLTVAAGLFSNLGSGSGTPAQLVDDLLTGPVLPTYTCVPGTDKLTATGDQQSGAAGAPLPKTLSVTATCTDSGNKADLPLYARTVTWAVNSGGGLVNGAPAAATQTPKENDLPRGVAAANWSLGPAAGTQTLTAQLEGAVPAQTVTFTATGVLVPVDGTCATGGGGTNFVDNTRRVIGAETWTLAGSPYRGLEVALDANAKLTIQPGVLVCVGSIRVPSGAALLTLGTANQKVRFSVVDPGKNSATLSFYSDGKNPGAVSLLRHVQADNLNLYAENQPLQIEDSRFVTSAGARQSQLCVGVSLKSTVASSVPVPMAVRRAVFDGYGGTIAGCEAAVVLDAQKQDVSGPSIFEARVVNALSDGVRVNGVEAAPAWLIKNCDIAQNGGAGIVLDGSASKPGATVTACTIARNKGPGINNKRSAAFVVSAAGNWWGDAAGPGGPAGGGLSAGVDATNALAAPPALGY